MTPFLVISGRNRRTAEATVRIIARAVIRRVLQELPAECEHELPVRLSAACPFGHAAPELHHVWLEEIDAAMLTRSTPLAQIRASHGITGGGACAEFN